MKRLVLILAAAALSVSCRGDELSGPDSETSRVDPVSAAATAPLAFRQVSAGTFHTCGVTTNNRAYCWGGNDKGQLGDGTPIVNVSRTTPKPVVGNLQFRYVTSGYEHTCGLTTDDRVYCWGLNFFGQLGNGTQGTEHFSVATPAEVVGGRRYKAVHAGYSHTCAITRADVAFCWGENDYGQLGDGTTTRRGAPVRVLGGLAWRQLAGGGEHTCGVTTSNQLYCWGLNDRGQLGIGNKMNRLKPAPVSGGLHFRQVDAGGYHTCAVTTADSGYCWGFNFQDALGDGSATERLTPGAVVGVRRYAQLSGGDLHSCGVTLAGKGFCWGRNETGQVGNGSVNNSAVPVQFSSGLVMRQVSAGLFHSCGVTTGDRAYCWGLGGLLGDGTTVMRLRPVPVVGPE